MMYELEMDLQLIANIMWIYKVAHFEWGGN